MAAPAIVFIHGMWSRPAAFAQLRAELEAAGLRTHALTLPHHDCRPGVTAATTPAPPALSKCGLGDYLAALRDQMQAIDGRVVLAGHSLGGLLAQQLAAEIQPAGLALLAPAPSAEAGAFGAAFSLGSAATFHRIVSRWGWWRRPTRLSERAATRGVFNGVPAAELPALLADLGWDSGRVLAEIICPTLFADTPSAVAYHRLTMPALVIAGTADHCVPLRIARRTARLLAANGARVDYEEWPDVGHWLFHNAVRPRLAAALARFVAAIG